MRKTVRIFSLMVALGMLFAAAPWAQAALTAGPVDAATGFPSFYADPNGVRLTICTAPGVCTVDPTGAENMYFEMTAIPPATSTVTGLVSMTVMGLYTTPTGAPLAGRESAANSLVIRFDNLPVAGIYTIQHPFGVTRATAVADAQGRVSLRFRRIFGGGNPGLPGFRAAQLGTVNHFLVQKVRPVGHLGNVNVPRPILGGGVNGNILVVTRPNGTVLFKQGLWGIGGQRAP